MPGIIIHNVLAVQTLDYWRDRPSEAPFPPDEPLLCEAFLHGCMGPDMGLYPGGDAFLSDLAHYVGTGELTRALLAQARTLPERAFAWGWLTHVLGDAWIHPLINDCAGRLTCGARPLTYADSPPTHVAVEVGLDGAFYARWHALRLPRAGPPFWDMVGHLRRAYQNVYGDLAPDKGFASNQRAWARWNQVSVWLAGSASAALYGRPVHFGWPVAATFRLWKALAVVFARGTVGHALIHPSAADSTLTNAVERVIDTFADRVAEYQRGDLRALPDFNLDTGSTEGIDDYPLSVRTLARLRERQKPLPVGYKRHLGRNDAPRAAAHERGVFRGAG